MSIETIKTLQREILKLNKELKNEKKKYDKLYRTTLEISKDFIKYTEKYPNHDINDATDPLNLININYAEIETFNFD